MGEPRTGVRGCDSRGVFFATDEHGFSRINASGCWGEFSFQFSRFLNLWQGCHMPLTPDRLSLVSRGQGADFVTGDQGAESSCRRFGSREAAKARSESRKVGVWCSLGGGKWASRGRESAGAVARAFFSPRMNTDFHG